MSDVDRENPVDTAPDDRACVLTHVVWTGRQMQFNDIATTAAFDAEVDPSPINSYAVVDLISSVDVGPGTLDIGIANLFDAFYFPAYAQRNTGFSETFNSAASGRRVTVGYRVTF